MNGTGPVEINGGVVYAYFTEDERGGLSARLSADEWERLGLHAGQWVRVRFPGQDVVELLLTAVSPAPPVVWLTLLSSAAVSARRVG